MSFSFDQLITVTFTLFAVIDIVGAIPLLIGSTSIISNLLKDNIRSLDVFIGLNFPIYKKRQQVYCYSNNMR